MRGRHRLPLRDEHDCARYVFLICVGLRRWIATAATKRPDGLAATALRTALTAATKIPRRSSLREFSDQFAQLVQIERIVDAFVRYPIQKRARRWRERTAAHEHHPLRRVRPLARRASECAEGRVHGIISGHPRREDDCPPVRGLEDSVLGRFVANRVKSRNRPGCANAPGERLVTEVDGGHHAEQGRADARRDAVLARAGYRVLGLDASLVIRYIEAAVARVRAALVG